MILEDALLLDVEETASPQVKKNARKGKAQSPIVESEVRRSIRVQKNNNGFKQSGCKKANCLGCKTDPPTLSVESLQSIGIKMCQLTEDEVAKAKLNKKKKSKPIAKKKNNDKGRNEGAEDGAGPSKEQMDD